MYSHLGNLPSAVPTVDWTAAAALTDCFRNALVLEATWCRSAGKGLPLLKGLHVWPIAIDDLERVKALGDNIFTATGARVQFYVK